MDFAFVNIICFLRLMANLDTQENAPNDANESRQQDSDVRTATIGCQSANSFRRSDAEGHIAYYEALQSPVGFLKGTFNVPRVGQRYTHRCGAFTESPQHEL